MSLIFIAIPTKGTVKHGSISEKFLRDLAAMHVACPQHTFIAPMVQDYQLLRFMDVEPTWADWGKHCRTLIERSDEVWVMMYEGWETSVGVTAEVFHAQGRGVPVFYIDPSVYRGSTQQNHTPE